MDLQIILQPVNNWFLYIEPTIHLDVKYIYIYIFIYIILLKQYVLSRTFSLIMLPLVSQNSKALLSQLSTLLLGLNLRNSFLSRPSLMILTILGGGSW